MKKGEYGYMEDAEHGIDIDVSNLYSTMFGKNEKESVKIEKLAKIFKLDTEIIKSYIYDESKPKPKKTLKKLIPDFSWIDLKELENLYKTAISMGNSKTLQPMKDIKKGIEVKKAIQILENISKLNSEFIKKLEINNWNSFDLDFSVKLENKKINHDIIKLNIDNFKEKNGLYAIFDGNTCLYIGVGRPIWQRIKSHYHSSQRPENEKSKDWSDFFSQYQKKLKIYWLQINIAKDNKINDHFSETLESIIKSIYNPKLNR